MGAVNAFIIATTAPGEEQRAAELLKGLWTGLGNNEVYRHWFWGYIQGLFFRSGLYNSAPLADTLQRLAKVTGGKYGRRLVVGMADLNTGTRGRGEG